MGLFLAGYEYDPLDGSKPVILAPWEVLHLRMFNPFSWFWGCRRWSRYGLPHWGFGAGAELRPVCQEQRQGGWSAGFADNINNTTWSQMREDIRAQHGGAVRNDLMLLRGAGQGAVRYPPMAIVATGDGISGGRRFTKEEIFGLYAPGYASMIDVNALPRNNPRRGEHLSCTGGLASPFGFGGKDHQ